MNIEGRGVYKVTAKRVRCNAPLCYLNSLLIQLKTGQTLGQIWMPAEILVPINFSSFSCNMFIHNHDAMFYKFFTV